MKISSYISRSITREARVSVQAAQMKLQENTKFDVNTSVVENEKIELTVTMKLFCSFDMCVCVCVCIQ